MLLTTRYFKAFIGEASANALSVSSFDCSFTVNKNTSKEANNAELSVYNLSKDSYEKLKNLKNSMLQIEAGYENHNGIIFIGAVRTVSYEKNGTDWVTKIHAFDGADKLDTTVMNTSYAPGTSYDTVLKDVKKTLKGIGIDTKILVKNHALEPFKSTTVKNGVTFGDGILPILEKILKPFNLKAYSNNSALIISSDKLEHTQGEGYLLSPNTCLIDSPVVNVEDTKKGQKTFIKAKSLLLPNLDIGSGVKIESLGVNDIFTVRAVTFSGDTKGSNWYAEMELV